MGASGILDDPTAFSLALWILCTVTVELAVLLWAGYHYKRARDLVMLEGTPDGGDQAARTGKKLMYLFVGLLPFPLGLVILLHMYLNGHLPT